MQKPDDSKHVLEFAADCPLAATLAERLRDTRMTLTTRWLERIASRVSLTPNRVFPTEELLDHVPLLILGIADYMESPAHAIPADAYVVAKAMELGALRHAQGFDEYEILKEYELLGGVLYAFLAEAIEDIDEPCSRGELLMCAHRLFHAVVLVQQATLSHYLRLTKEQLIEREERLRAFNRALTHEFRNRIGAVMGAAQLLDLTDLSDAERQRLSGVVVRNVDSMRAVLENLLELTRGNVDARHQRHVRLPEAVAEAIRQLRDMARAQRVELRVADRLPDLEVSAAVVELSLTNFISNAIKYADPEKPARWVEVRGRIAGDAHDRPREVIVEVRDNGIGVPERQRARLFQRFFRAHEGAAPDVEGTGLGLSIVRDAVENLGGRVWAEFPAEGSLFAFAVPSRRAGDAQAARADETASLDDSL